MEHGCFVDGINGEEPCVLDPDSGFCVEECDVAVRLMEDGKTQEQCSYYRLVSERQTFFEHTCPKCGHHFDSP